ncbi:(2E,6E)-farnesyl diphosphate synthase [Pokkaliibacter plantistimulans]|uniref:(2E,6E)-farnesyl diphosphate synthase n=1 Tax=Proteobacteria bacterium 228 TaxID=2083153 RepID=A0A2S5KQY3_9PROT|nr:farnesyl diphosphate synthase [Pokkaliibacter plantistimulans]PPC76939.1 (2E,6E)-farnesyl diphosphate synthase [Pokkaliibacter plantistimulans]
MHQLQTASLHWQQQVDEALERYIADYAGAELLIQAMRYSLFNGGKRIRPILCYATSQALQVDTELLDAYSAAIECIHAYSLIHDDLPAMDDDDLRRGKPTCHIAYGEATAILAGDALNTLAFQLISEEDALPAAVRLQLIRCLSRAAGMHGMVAGQMMDMAATGQQITLPQLERLHRHKTGALLLAAVEGPALVAQPTEAIRTGLQEYARCIGLAFQVQDDILDIEGDTATLGKPQGSDLQHNKSTYPALLGLEQAREYAAKLIDTAITSLAPLGDHAALLRELAYYIVRRNH